MTATTAATHDKHISPAVARLLPADQRPAFEDLAHTWLHICDILGAPWEWVFDEFVACTPAQIEAWLENEWPGDDNAELALSIFWNIH